MAKMARQRRKQRPQRRQRRRKLCRGHTHTHTVKRDYSHAMEFIFGHQKTREYLFMLLFELKSFVNNVTANGKSIAIHGDLRDAVVLVIVGRCRNHSTASENYTEINSVERECVCARR
jgi:hypothetical protein